MKRRTARIFPIYYLILAILAISSVRRLDFQDHAIDLALSGIFLTNQYIISIGHWGAAFNQAWTLAIEEQFYLLAAPLLLAVRPDRTWPICVAIAVGGAFWGLWLSVSLPGSMAPGMSSLANFSLIAIGGMFAIRPSCPSSAAVTRWVQPLSLAGLLLIPFVPDSINTNALRMFVQPVLVAVLLCELRDHIRTPVSMLLGSRIFVYFGQISYGFYLLHQFVTADFLSSATAGVLDITRWTPSGQFLPLLLASILLADCSWRWLERPVVRAARRSAAGSLGHEAGPRPLGFAAS